MAMRNPQRDGSGRMDRFADRRKRYMAVLRTLGLEELFAAMSRPVQDGFLHNKFPDPVLEFDDTFPTDRAHRDLRKEIERGFRRASVVIEDGEITFRDFFAVITGLHFTARDTTGKLGYPAEVVRFLDEAGPFLDYWYHQHVQKMFVPLHGEIISPLVAHSRLDTRIFRVDCKQEFTANGKYLIRTIVGAEPAEERRVQLDGGIRPMYRVGTGNEWHEVKWLSWDGAELARPSQKLPVYVQSHALRQLQNRANLPRLAPWLEYWLYHSLKVPNIIQRQGGDLLVEYRMQSYRLGYLVVTPTKDLVAVRTFLFLTMEPSPESRLLRKQMHLSRREVDWLGLSDLAAFAQTDLKNDAVLRDLFAKCGCGHLFELEYLNAADCAPKPFAGEVRKFLGIAA